MDGIDVAVLKTDGETIVERGETGFFPYSAQTREMLEQSLVDAAEIKDRDERPGNLSEAEERITSLHVDAVKVFLSQNQIAAEEVDVLGFHGQTVLHRPDEALTVQLGDGAKLATETGIVTVYDMRANDMEFSGQGAPLVPIYHKALSQNLSEEFAALTPVVFVNIGGISNITYVGEELIAFDAGPGNALIDQWVQAQVGISHDQGGMIAAEGKIDQMLVDRYITDPFFEKPVPKSLDRNDFQLEQFESASIETVARSLARVTAESILKSAKHLPDCPKLWIICGGGRHNPHIMNDLQALAEEAGSKAIKSEEAGFDGDAMESEAWAYLAVRSLRELPLTYPLTTGCTKPVTGGKLILP